MIPNNQTSGPGESRQNPQGQPDMCFLLVFSQKTIFRVLLKFDFNFQIKYFRRLG
jgi:hypothetical protein